MQRLVTPALLSGNEAVAFAVRQCDVDVIAAYPITPQTTIVEKLSSYVAGGELRARFISVESEHSALSACIGASAVGARTFTATSSQGLALMHEIMYVASGMRMPLVMTVANRALSAPINIHGDHSDTMGSRDAGWIQIFCENVQEAYTRIIQAYRLAEDSRVLLPVAVNIDGFTLSHCYERVEPLEDETVQRYLPRRQRPVLEYENPLTMGAFSLPNTYFEIKMEQAKALSGSRNVFEEVVRDYPGIKPGMNVIHVFNPGAPVKLVAMGSMAGTLRHAVKTLGLNDCSVVSIKMFRPFPREELVATLSEADLIAVFDRALSPGAVSNPLSGDIKSMLYDEGLRKTVWNIVYGLGGREVTMTIVKTLLTELSAARSKGIISQRTIYLQGVATS
ncbi:MAG: pyruvate ferredoxin oxidoreductase [Nitrososphaerota archaeon]